MRTIVRWMTTLSVAILLTSHSLHTSSGPLALALPVDPSPNKGQAPNPPLPPAPKSHLHPRAPVIKHKNPPPYTPELVETTPTELFSIINPAPGDVWVTGTIENIYWDSGTDLPEGTTFDVSLIPVITEQDAKTWSRLPANPQAMLKTVRPMRRKVDPETHNFDLIVPYDLVSRPLLEQARQKAAELQVQELKQRQQQQAAGDETVTQKDEDGKNKPAQPSSAIRVVITAYDGNTNKKIAEASVFPVLVQLEEYSSLQRVDMFKLYQDEVLNGRPKPTRVLNENDSLSEMEEDEDVDPEQSDVPEDEDDDEDEDEDEYEDVDDDVDTEAEFEDGEPLDDYSHNDAHAHDHAHDHDEGEGESEGEGDEHDHDHDDVDGSLNSDLKISEDELDTLPPDDPPPPILHAGTLEITRWNIYKVRFFTGTPYVIGWDWSRNLLHPEDRNKEWDPELGAKVEIKVKPGLKKPGPAPNTKRQDSQQDQEEQGDIPPEHQHEHNEEAEEGGQHEHKHEHRPKPSPTLDEQSLPQTWALEDLEALDGQTNVYIEDVLTGQRYAVAAASQPASIRALYFTPSLHMIGPNAKPTPKGVEPSPNVALDPDAGRILLHARVEMDLYKDGAILRFTGFSKPFYVEQGAL
ncbi:hypothetical protein BGZ73_002488 [Actinomortierella ambigua]|nr:hypothetical protein BGZ73_002488 [Actinomortierella ambigua]